MSSNGSAATVAIAGGTGAAATGAAVPGERREPADNGLAVMDMNVQVEPQPWRHGRPGSFAGWSRLCRWRLVPCGSPGRTAGPRRRSADGKT